MGRNILEFSSINEFVEYAKQHDPTKSMWGEVGRKEFFGCNNNAEAVEMALNGWHEGLINISERVGLLKIGEDTTKEVYQYDVVGDVLDIGAFLSGEPECWLGKKEIQDKPHLDVVINISISGSIKKESIYNRGAAIIALIDYLSNIYNLSVKAYFGSSGFLNRREEELDAFVDMGNSPLDIDSIAFAVVHPAFFRYIGTAAIDVFYKMNIVGHWHPIDLKKRDQEKILYIPSMDWQENDNFKTIEKSKKWLHDKIKKYERGNNE